MRCRRIVNSEDGVKHIVWFGSYGIRLELQPDGTYKKKAKFYNSQNKHDNYASEKESVRDSLIQRLSVIKNELWYDYNYGVPLTDKVKDKSIMDAWFIKTINNQPDVVSVLAYESEVVKNTYSCYFVCSTKYGLLEIGI